MTESIDIAEDIQAAEFLPSQHCPKTRAFRLGARFQVYFAAAITGVSQRYTVPEEIAKRAYKIAEEAMAFDREYIEQEYLKADNQ